MELQHTNPDGSVVVVEYSNGRFTTTPMRTPDIDATAAIGTGVRLLGNNVEIGVNSRIGDRVEIGAGSKIHGDVIVRDDVVIGENAIILHKVIVDTFVWIGNRVRVRPGVHITAWAEVPTCSVVNAGADGTPIIAFDIEAAREEYPTLFAK